MGRQFPIEEPMQSKKKMGRIIMMSLAVFELMNNNTLNEPYIIIRQLYKLGTIRGDEI